MTESDQSDKMQGVPQAPSQSGEPEPKRDFGGVVVNGVFMSPNPERTPEYLKQMNEKLMRIRRREY